jgi:cyclophilin family peptidyl-prolyl cis-trans isomerase
MALKKLLVWMLPTITSGLLFGAPCLCTLSASAAGSGKSAVVNPEGAVEPVEIVVGPFDLHRKYRSMEGPWVAQKFRIGDLLASKHLVIPESMIKFVEGNSKDAPAMNSGAPVMNGAAPASSALGSAVGLVDTSAKKRELVWFKGVRLDVLDENDKPLPNAEFICHFNLDIDPAFRKKVFPKAQHSGNTRVMTLTQGQTDFHFPEGTAVPVASDEKWTFTFQAANRTTEQHRRVKHRLTIDLLKDSDAKEPITALFWYVPYIVVVTGGESKEATEVEHNGAPSCLGTSAGTTAPNTVPGGVFKDQSGRKLSGHWVVPPGDHTWRTPILEERDPGFANKDMRIHAAWTHIHPLCTAASLVQCNGESRRPIFTANVKTKTAGGLQIMTIDNIISKQGILLPAGHHYELEAKYSNPTGENQDSMVSHGVYVADSGFSSRDLLDETQVANQDNVLPVLELASSKDGLFCGVKNLTDRSLSTVSSTTAAAKSPYDIVPPYPPFDLKRDGPLLQEEKVLELDTSQGKLHIVLDPKFAPQHATQLYRLFKAGAFDGTGINRYEPNFVLQVDVVDRKADGKAPLSAEVQEMLRRLPLEVSAQTEGGVLHKKGCLSMARYDQPDTAVTSFSIMLGNAPHLDGKYTIFGRIIPDRQTLETLDHMQKQFANEHPYISAVREIPRSLATSDSKQ